MRRDDRPSSPSRAGVRRDRPRALVLALFTLACGVATGGCGPDPDDGGAAIDPDAPIIARFETTRGAFAIELLDDRAPILAANFAFTASRGLHDDVPIAGANSVLRLVRHPDGEGPVANWTNPPEFAPDLRFDGPGRVAYSRVSEADDSPVHALRFFVTIKEQRRYTFRFPIFAQVVEGMDVVTALDDATGDVIRRVTLEGPWEALLARHPEQVATWRAGLGE